MKIYTKTGDKGMTKLVGGSSVSKDSDRVSAYGTIDELNSWIGYAISCLPVEFGDTRAELQEIQQYLFDCGTDLATPVATNRPERLTEGAVTLLENRIDFYTAESPDIESFILPGGSTEASLFHMARTIARRAERELVHLNWTTETNPFVLKFLNRLSDYFYALARYMNVRKGVEDIFYKRSGKVFHSIKKDGL